ncbi:MAG TPA: TlpA disulfide reductase family protein [Usitatibacteraceae bacterium]|nr:TlpA disulfide reductase family protein [Usitatibacteraceae bacterium]
MQRRALLAGLLLGTLAGCGRNTGFRAEPVPAFELPHLGKAGMWSSREFGRAAVLNFWATWCGPCRQEMDSLERLHLALQDSGIAVIGISVDRDARNAEEFILARKLTFPNLHDPESALAARALQVRVLPTTFVISNAGNIVERVERAEDWAAPRMRERILELVQRRAS